MSVVVAPVADGSIKTQTLFMEKAGLSDDTPMAFSLKEVKDCGGGAVWLRYGVKEA